MGDRNKVTWLEFSITGTTDPVGSKRSCSLPAPTCNQLCWHRPGRQHSIHSIISSARNMRSLSLFPNLLHPPPSQTRRWDELRPSSCSLREIPPRAILQDVPPRVTLQDVPPRALLQVVPPRALLQVAPPRAPCMWFLLVRFARGPLCKNALSLFQSVKK
ncbi:hypothetical protein BC936DRAFT_137070 [Jimgerdemannia flammicorona]|uniref:Uncharacterized protein n=1 Tax=Jimgerdemannia flammicorona TaxID=994334 RepID=A0A433CY41_9FUNG|nr:hypothetical protein BC936DRAFT_137070 [Jimgerdemannia flammicorona]